MNLLLVLACSKTFVSRHTWNIGHAVSFAMLLSEACLAISQQSSSALLLCNTQEAESGKRSYRAALAGFRASYDSYRAGTE